MLLGSPIAMTGCPRSIPIDQLTTVTCDEICGAANAYRVCRQDAHCPNQGKCVKVEVVGTLVQIEMGVCL